MENTRIIQKIIFYTIFFVNSLWAQNFNLSDINSVVLIEKFTKDGIKPHGVGVIVSNKENEDVGVVITNAHLINYDSLLVTMNASPELIEFSKKTGIHNFTSNLIYANWELIGKKIRTKIWKYKDGTKRITKHPIYDIAVFAIWIPRRHNMEMALGKKFGSQSKVEPTNISTIVDRFASARTYFKLGDKVYFFGFPYQLGVSETIYPIVRSGIISWKDPKSKTFLIDALSYGGNSGSPVFSKIKDKDNKSYLVGIVFGHHALKTKGVEYENLGLVRCVDVSAFGDFIKNTEFDPANGRKSILNDEMKKSFNK